MEALMRGNADRVHGSRHYILTCVSLWKMKMLIMRGHAGTGSSLHQYTTSFYISGISIHAYKGCGMGPWLVLVSPCFRENVVATCTIWSFLCSLWSFTSGKRNCSLFWKSNFKMALIWKIAIFDVLFTFSSHQGKVTKIPSVHISNTYIHVFCSPYWLFCLTNSEKIRIYQVRFLFGMSPGVDSYLRHFGTMNGRMSWTGPSNTVELFHGSPFF